MIRTLFGFFFTLLFSHNVFAGALCDAACELSITFPDGGSIEAVKPMTITFGEGGFINNGIVTTGYFANETVSLLAGEKLDFSNDGIITLGSGGDISYTDMIFNSTGGAIIKAVGGTDTITIFNLVIAGGLNMTIDASNIVISGAMSIEQGGTLNIIADTGAVTPSVCSIQDSTAGALTLTSGAPIVTTDSCNIISTMVSLPVGTLSVGIIDPNATLISTGTITLTPTPTTGNIGPLQPVLLTQEYLATLSDGVELPTDDGNTCSLSAGECITASGAKYVVVEGKLVPSAADGSGMINLAGLLSLFSLLIILRISRTGCRASSRKGCFC